MLNVDNRSLRNYDRFCEFKRKELGRGRSRNCEKLEDSKNVMFKEFVKYLL